jgi:hypothetical protein
MQVALCKRAETGWPTSDWPNHLGWWPISVRQGRALSHGGAGGCPAGFRWHPAMRCSGEGPGSKAVGWWTHFGAAGRKISPKECALRCGVFSRRGMAVGVASGGGGQQLAVWEGCTRRRSARGVVESVGERPEQAIYGG